MAYYPEVLWTDPTLAQQAVQFTSMHDLAQRDRAARHQRVAEVLAQQQAQREANQLHGQENQDRLAYEYARLMNQDRQFQSGEERANRALDIQNSLGKAQLENAIKVAEIQSKNLGRYGSDLILGTGQMNSDVETYNNQADQEAAALNSALNVAKQKKAVADADVHPWALRNILGGHGMETAEVHSVRLKGANQMAFDQVVSDLAGKATKSKYDPVTQQFVPVKKTPVAMPGAGGLKNVGVPAEQEQEKLSRARTVDELPVAAGALRNSANPPTPAVASTEPGFWGKAYDYLGRSMARGGGVRVSAMDQVKLLDQLKSDAASGLFDYDGGKDDFLTQYQLLTQ